MNIQNESLINRIKACESILVLTHEILPHIRGKIFVTGGLMRDLVAAHIRKQKISTINVVYNTADEDVKDVDIEVFDTTVEQLQEDLSKLNGNNEINEVGKSFGVFKLTYKTFWDFEFALARKEKCVGKKHQDFEISFDSLSLKDAAARRDFTVNAIYFCPSTSQLFDPTGRGITDLQAMVLHPSSEQFKEDPLRVLRAMQFIARFNFKPSDLLLKYGKELSYSIETISEERIWHEFTKMIKNNVSFFIKEALLFLADVNWYPYFFNERKSPNKKLLSLLESWDYVLSIQETSLSYEDHLVIFLGILMKQYSVFEDVPCLNMLKAMGVPKKYKLIASELWFLNIPELIEEYYENPNIFLRKQQIKLYPLTFDLFFVWFKIYCSFVYTESFLSELHNTFKNQTSKNFDLVKGRDLVEWGIEPGPCIGNQLNLLQNKWISGEINTKEEAKEYTKKFLMYVAN